MSNKTKSYILGILLSAVVISALPSKAYAFVVPAIDPKSIILNIKSYFTKVMESETVVKTIKTVKKTSAAIGNAKKTVTEYITENKKNMEAEEAAGKEYVRGVQEFQKLYSEYKGMVEQGIESAKKYKDDIETGIDTAKELADSVPDVVGNVKNQVNEKVSDVTAKVESVLPENDKTNDNEDNLSASSTPDVVEQTPAKENDVNQQQLLTVDNNAPTSSRKTFVNTQSPTTNNVSADVNSNNVTVNPVVVNAKPVVVQQSPEVIETINVNTPMQQPLLKQEVQPEVQEISVQTQELNVNDNLIENINTEEALLNNEDIDVIQSENSEIEINEEEIKTSDETSDIKEEQARAMKPILRQDNALMGVNKKIPVSDNKTVKTIPVANKIKIESTKTKNINVQPVSTRKAFTTSSVSRSDNMAFAMAMTLPDNGTNVNGTLIVPQAMALACGVSSSTALEKDVVDNCLVWLNEERKKDQVDNPYNAPDVFNQITSTYAAGIMAESYKALNDAEYFEENFVEPIQYAPDNNAQDTYANIIELGKSIDIQMNNLLKIQSTILAAKTIENYYTYGFINYENPEIVVAENIGKDNGTGADGVFQIPQQMALTCGLDSETIKDVTLTDECFNTLANISENDGFNLIRDIILHQTNKQAMELALKVKSEAGDFEDKQAEALKDETVGQSESPAAIGAKGEEEGANISAAQQKNAKLVALSANNILTLMDVYSMRMALDTLINFYTYDAPGRIKTES